MLDPDPYTDPDSMNPDPQRCFGSFASFKDDQIYWPKFLLHRCITAISLLLGGERCSGRLQPGHPVW
jgi:hypothetical protein